MTNIVGFVGAAGWSLERECGETSSKASNGAMVMETN